MAKHIFALVIVIIFSIVAGLPLLHQGLHPTHDGEYHIIRFYEFDKVLREGSLYPRWATDLNNGYGVPLFNYVYPLPNYVASLFHVFGFSFINSFKLQMFLASIIGGVFFYLWSRRHWGVVGGIVASVFYTYSPYRFVDIYVRGSVGEVWAISLFPVLLYVTDVFFEKRQSFYLVASSIFLSLIIFSHNILGLLFFIFYVSYVFYVTYEKNTWRTNMLSIFTIILFGLGLSSIFWVPALLERNYVTGLQIYNIVDNFPEFYQLIIPSWGTGFFNTGSLGSQMSAQIGIANVLGIIFGVLALKKLSRKRQERSIILFFLVWFFLAFLLMLRISSSLWEFIPFMQYFQFPWRLLSIVVIVAPFFGGSIFLVVRRKVITAVILIILAIGLTIGYTNPAYYHDRTDSYYTTRDNFINGTNSPGDLFNTIWMKKDLHPAKDGVIILRGKGEVSVLEEKSTKLTFSMNASEPSRVAVARAYFPGWQAYVNGEKITVEPDSSGIVSFSIPVGDHKIDVQFENTLVRKLATVIFFISLVAILAFFFWTRYCKTYI